MLTQLTGDANPAQGFAARLAGLDTTGDPSDPVRMGLVTFSGLLASDNPGSIDAACRPGVLAVPLAAGSAGAVDAASLDLPSGLVRRSHALVATLTHAQGVARDFRYLVPLAEVEGLGGKVTARRTAEGVVVSSSGWRLRVGVETYESPVIWSDNYFDLLPGEARTLRVAHGVTPTHVWVVAGMGQRALLPLTGDIEL